jgi:hypothetical protein
MPDEKKPSRPDPAPQQPFPPPEPDRVQKVERLARGVGVMHLLNATHQPHQSGRPTLTLCSRFLNCLIRSRAYLRQGQATRFWSPPPVSTALTGSPSGP